MPPGCIATQHAQTQLLTQANHTAAILYNLNKTIIIYTKKWARNINLGDGK